MPLNAEKLPNIESKIAKLKKMSNNYSTNNIFSGSITLKPSETIKVGQQGTGMSSTSKISNFSTINSGRRGVSPYNNYLSSRK